MSWETEFLTALTSLQATVEEPIEYRIHYNSAGDITLCTMQNHPADTMYIVVSQDEYNNYFHYTVVDSKLKKIDNQTGYSVKLKKSTTGYKVVKDHAGLLLEPGETYAETEYYDQIN